MKKRGQLTCLTLAATISSLSLTGCSSTSGSDGKTEIRMIQHTKNGRDINRHYYSMEEVEKEQNRPVVQKLKELMVLRNTHPAFSLDGTIEISADDDLLVITRKYGTESITLKANLTTYQFDIQ